MNLVECHFTQSILQGIRASLGRFMWFCSCLEQDFVLFTWMTEKKKKLCGQKMGKNPKRALISETITSAYQLFVTKILDGFVITFLDMKRLHYPDTVKKNAIFNGTILIFLIIHYFFSLEITKDLWYLKQLNKPSFHILFCFFDFVDYREFLKITHCIYEPPNSLAFQGILG